MTTTLTDEQAAALRATDTQLCAASDAHLRATAAVRLHKHVVDTFSPIASNYEADPAAAVIASEAMRVAHAALLAADATARAADLAFLAAARNHGLTSHAITLGYLTPGGDGCRSEESAAANRPSFQPLVHLLRLEEAEDGL